jgi:hypothetical protein
LSSELRLRGYRAETKSDEAWALYVHADSIRQNVNEMVTQAAWTQPCVR